MIGEGIFTQDGPQVSTTVSLCLLLVLAVSALHLSLYYKDLPLLQKKNTPSHSLTIPEKKLLTLWST
jgi:hypothetical protein